MNASQGFEILLNEVEDGLILFIDSDKNNTLFFNESEDNYEAKYQLKEGCFYDYAFSDSSYRLTCNGYKSIVQEHKRNSHSGKISPNIYVGTLDLEIYHNSNPSKTYKLQLEVQSVKTSYREDYRYMLNDIAEYCTELILSANSPVSHSFEINPALDNQTLYQRFAFVKAMLESEEFNIGLQRIISNPTTNWKTHSESTDVRQIKRFTSKNIRQLIHSPQKIKLPTQHSLQSLGIDSIATKIESSKKTEHIDTNENRFIKHALNTYLRFCEEIYNHPNAEIRLKKEAFSTIELLENNLQHSFFKEISRPTTLKLNSPILQRKEGYREQLKTWLNFDLAAKLIWKGGEDVYSGGKKDIATLYEYWLFFKLLEVVEKTFQLYSKGIEELIKPSKDGLNLTLKQGEFTAIEGIYNQANRDLNIRFNYNRSFKNNNSIKDSGSWTTTLRPDYTLSIWLKELSEPEAERQEQIVHIHFDAKYKVSNLNHLLSNGDANQEKEENKKGIYKNADLLKMHAYKDAIRRTGGAYVLYPGSKEMPLKSFHEILPGLGAFPVNPTKGSNETEHLEHFLKKVLEHFLNRTTQRENLASKRYEIIKDNPTDKLQEPIPEYINGQKIIPDETFVLVGFYKSQKQYKWIIKNGLYNFRMGTGNGSFPLNEKTVKAKYLLIHTKGQNSTDELWKIKGKGFKVYSKEDLLKKQYPSPSQPYYLVLEIEKVTAKEFENVRWNFKGLINYQSAHASAYPFTATLSELMRNKEI